MSPTSSSRYRRTGSPRSTTKPRPSYISATACSRRGPSTVSGKCSRWIDSSGRPEVFAAARARSTSAISASVSVTIQEVSRARVSPRQAFGLVIGVMHTWLTGLPPRSATGGVLLVPRVQHVAQAVAQHVEGHDDAEDHETRVERHPGRLGEIALGRVEHAAPRRRGGGGAP